MSRIILVMARVWGYHGILRRRGALGTAGSVKNAEDFLDETFIVVSGDSLTDIDLTRAVEFPSIQECCRDNCTPALSLTLLVTARDHK